MCKITQLHKRAATGLILISLFLSIASCGSNGDNKGDANTTAAVSTVEEVTETDYLTNIPVYDFKGSTFRLMVNSQSDRPNLHAGEENGEIINDAMFSRDQQVSEIFNLEFEYIAYEERLKLYKDATRMISAGEDFADVIITALSEGVGNLSLDGMLVDLNSLGALDLGRDWWNQSMNETMKTGNKIYAVTGPMALCYAYSPYAFFTNLTIANDFGIENIYELVETGKWTIDKMNSLMKDVYADVNNNGIADIEDRFAMTVTEESGKAFYIGCGMRMAQKTNDGAELLIDTPKSIEVLDKLNQIMKPDHVICTDKLNNNPAGISYKIALFTNSQALFCAAPIQWGVLNFRDMKDDYGILPYPKYNEDQDDYYSHVNSYFPVGIAIPVTNPRAEETAAVMETLAYISHNKILPKINNVVLKEKIARDENSKHMLDLLYKNMIVDLNCVFDFAGSATKLRSYAVGTSENFSSTYASIKPAVEAALAQMLEKLS
jgi:hypothetical protein